MTRNLTHIAAEAIIAQITSKADVESNCYGTVGDDEIEFTAWFTVEWNGPIQDEVGPEYYEPHCVMIGAYGENPETGEMIAGNRAEMIDLVGKSCVWSWEGDQEEYEMEHQE